MKTKSKICLLVPMVLGILLLSQNTVLSQVWTGVGSAFVPDENSLTKYEFTGAQFRFKVTKTGTISARCNVTNPLDQTSVYGAILAGLS